MATLPFLLRQRARRDPRSPEPHALPVREPADDVDNTPDDARDRWWYESSYDLRCGLDVDDDIASTMPGELIDQLFKR